jgi:hypothetical protein
MSRASLAEVARTSLLGDERDRVPHPLLGCVGGSREGVCECRAVGDGSLERVAGGNEGIDHRLVSRLGLAAGLDAGNRGRERRRPVVGAELAFPGETASHLQEQSPVQRTAGAADRRHECHADGLQQRTDVLFSRRGVDLAENGRHPSVHVDPVISVADGGVELGQVVLVRLDVRGEPPDPADDVVVRDVHAAKPPIADRRS